MPEIRTYREALREAIVHELDRDESVVLIGEDIGVYGGTHLITVALLEKYGAKRVIDTPICEGGFTGAAIGMAMMGMRPIVEMMTMNFSFLAVDQIIQNAAKVRYFSGGQVKVPLVIRGPNGGGVQLSAQHTHSLESFYGHFPGLKVVAPASPNDAKGMMLTAVRDDNCVIFLEAGALYGTKGEVDEDNPIPFGKAPPPRAGAGGRATTLARAPGGAVHTSGRHAGSRRHRCRGRRPSQLAAIGRRCDRHIGREDPPRGCRAGAMALVRGGQRGGGDHPGQGVRLPGCSGGAGERSGSPGALRAEPRARGFPGRAARGRGRSPGSLPGGEVKMPEVIMPKMGDAMEAGTLSTWLKSEGDEVEIGDVLAEIETDKATMELTAEDAGILQEIIASEGDAVPVGEAIAVIVGEGEEAPPRREAKHAEDGARGDAVDEAPAATATEGKAPEEQKGKAPEDEEGGPSPADGRVRASPIVRRLAGEHNIDLSGIRGTGPPGPIVERDVRTALETVGGPVEERPADSTTAGPAPTGAPGTELKPLSRMQRVVGERMQQSWRQAPHHYATVGVHVDDLLALRGQLNAELEEDGIKLSINDFVMKACAVALRKFPKLNSLWTSEGIERHATVDLAMAVALEDGLITPVIKDGADKTLSGISIAARELASRAREGKLEPHEFQGGTFTVSNMGMYGVESFTAIVNPPSVAIVAGSSLIRRPGFDAEDNVVPQNTMKLTIGSDHRVVNGAENALYLAEVKRLLERPVLLTV